MTNQVIRSWASIIGGFEWNQHVQKGFFGAHKSLLDEVCEAVSISVCYATGLVCLQCGFILDKTGHRTSLVTEVQ